MKIALEDIRTKLKDGLYKNEEQIRFSLIGRILIELGWDIWNPKEVNTEFHVAKSEDNTKVDIALFVWPNFPSVYIEIKAHSKIEQNLSNIEKQLRDYNRNNTATFTIITDGQQWRFYYSQTGGEFADKCYRIIDFLKDDIEQLEDEFTTLLSKNNIVNGGAKHIAEKYLELSTKERVIKDALPEANKMMDNNPLLNKVQAIEQSVKEKGYQITQQEILDFLNNSTNLVNPPTILQLKSDPQQYKHNHTPESNQKFDQDVSADKNLREKIFVQFPDGTKFNDNNVTETFLKTIEKIGTNQIKRLQIIKSKVPLISDSKNDKYQMQHQLGGYFVMTKLSTNDKFNVLREINKRLILNLILTKA